MALSLGQLLGGAGTIATRQRQAEEAERTARQNQLLIEERNRLDAFRREQLRAGVPEFAPGGGLQIPEPMGTRPIVQAPTLTAAPAPTAAPAAAAPPAAPPPAAPAPAAAPAVDQFEALYERVKGLKRQGITGRLTYTRDLNMLADKRAFSDEDIARIYAIALNKQDSSTANTLKDILIQRGVDRAYLRDVAAKSRQAQRSLAGVRRQEEKQAAADEERRRLFELKTGRKVETATAGEVVTPGMPAAPTAAPAAAPAGLNSQQAIARVIQREGGYVNDPADIGGETKFGISKNAYPNLNIANITEAQAAEIYKRDYWDAINADQLPANIREAAFDAAVNQGVAWTKQALAQAGNDLQKFLQLRAARYQQIVDANPSQQRFLEGWMNRLRDVASGVVEAVVPTAAAAAPTAPAAPPPAAGVAVAPTAPVDQANLYLANPQAVSRDMEMALRQREEAVRIAEMYRRSGMGNEFTIARAKVMELDNNMMYLQGMQGIQEFGLANDPRRLSAVWSEYSGMRVNVQPRSDGKFDILVGDRRAREGLTQDQVVNMARLSFDSGYRQSQAQAGAEANMEVFKAQLEIQKDQAKQTAQMIREIAVAQTQGNINQALEWAKANFKWDITPTGAGDGTIIIRPPGGTPYLFNASGRTVEIDGVKVQTNSAYPIAGLPSYGGAVPR